MKHARLDATLVDAPAVHARLARDLGLGDHFGANLDALWDSLTADVPGPVEIVWQDGAAARARLGETFDRFAALFREVEAARSDFRFRIQD